MDGRVAERDVLRWSRELGRVAERIAPRFGRPELRARAPVYFKGLIAGLERKNGWQLAEFAGDATPTNLQHFLGRAKWDADAVRDDLVRYVAAQSDELDSVLVVDETGFLKRGTRSAGVGRMYSGTAGRIEPVARSGCSAATARRRALSKDETGLATAGRCFSRIGTTRTQARFGAASKS